MENLIVDTSNIKILFVILLIGILGAYVYFEMRQIKDKLKQYEKTCQSLNEVKTTMSKLLQIEEMQAYKTHDIVSEQQDEKEEQEEPQEVKPVEQGEPVIEQEEPIEKLVVDQEAPAELQVEPINISTEDESDEIECPTSDIEDIYDIGENPFVSSVCDSGHSILFSEIEKLMSESEIGKAEPVQDVHTFEDITCEPDLVSESKSEETIDIEINDKYETMTVSQLKEKLEEYKLPVSGNKTKMKQRLRDYEESK